MGKFTLFNIALACMAWLSCAATAKELPNHLAFIHIFPNEVTSIGDVQSIEQDRHGFMWFGGTGGIARYDGYQLNFYGLGNHGRQSGLSSTSIFHIFKDSQQDLWVATSNGLHKYNAELDRFVNAIDHEKNKVWRKSNQITRITEDRQGMLWLATPSGLYRFNPKSGALEIVRYALNAKDNLSPYLNTIILGPDGNLWIGTRDFGLVQMDPSTQSIRHFAPDTNNPNALQGKSVNAIFFDRNGRLWLGTRKHGINTMQPDGKSFNIFAISEDTNRFDVRDFTEDKHGRLWAVGDFGTVVINQNRDKFIRHQKQSSGTGNQWSDIIRTLFIDREGDFWFGYFPSGIDLLDPQASTFKNYYPTARNNDSLLEGGVRGTFLDNNNTVWVGTGSGVSRLNLTNDAFENYTNQADSPIKLNGKKVLSINGDSEGNIWIGYWQEGIDVLNPQQKTVTHFSATNELGTLKITGDQPWQILNDTSGNTWIATNKGLNRYNKEKNIFEYFRPNASILDPTIRFYIRSLHEDSAGNIWLGSPTGFYRFNANTRQFKVFREDPKDPNSINENFVTAIYEDSNKIIWAGTKGGGLNRLDTKNNIFTHFTEKNGLPDDFVSSIVEDNAKNLWFSTQSGLVKMDLETKELEIYDKQHGLPGNSFNRNTLTKTDKGWIIGGTSEGLAVHNPNEYTKNTIKPTVEITDFTISNKRLQIGTDTSPLKVAPQLLSSIKLAPEHAMFSIHFSALSYRQSQNNAYTYRLKGFDENWQMSDTHTPATYTNLDPGHYTFEVKGANNDGLWGDQVRSVSITVLPKLWQTWWAYILYATATIILIYFILMYTWKKQAYVKEKTLNRKLTHLDRLKDELLANTSHELRTPLNGIIGLSEVILTELEQDTPKDKIADMVKVILFSGMRLSKLVDDIMDFSKLRSHNLVLNRENINLKCFIDNMLRLITPLAADKDLVLINKLTDEQLEVYADEKRLEQIFFNLLGNAIKFTFKGEITVAAQKIQGGTRIDICDTGIGISKENLGLIFESYEQVEDPENHKFQGTGLGLTITKRLIELHKGAITVESELNKGTCFQLYFPNKSMQIDTIPHTKERLSIKQKTL